MYYRYRIIALFAFVSNLSAYKEVAMIVPEITQVGAMRKTYALIEPKGSVYEDGTPIAKEDVMFNIDTYKYFVSKPAKNKGWDVVTAVNDILNRLNEQEYNSFVLCFAKVKKIITDYIAASTLIDSSPVSLIPSVVDIDRLTIEMFKATDLARKIDEYLIERPMPNPEINVNGNTAHHTRESTWHVHEYQVFYRLIVVCKLMFPIFGHLVFAISIVPSASKDASMKFCMGTFKSIRKEYYAEITEKLITYIQANLRVNRFSENDNNLLAMTGFTINSLVTHLVGYSLVKLLVNTDMYHDNKNIVTYIYTTIIKAGMNKYRNYRKHNSYQMHLENRGDEDEPSVMEIITPSIKDSADTRTLVELNTFQWLDKHQKEFKYKSKDIDQAVEYYQRNGIGAGYISDLILGFMVSSVLGGSYGINYLSSVTVLRVITAIQLQFCQEGFTDVVPLLTIRKLGAVTELDKVRNSLIITRGSGMNMRNVSQLYSHLDESFNWNQQVDELVKLLTKYSWYMVLAPVVRKAGNFADDCVYEFEADIIDRLYGLIYDKLSKRGAYVYSDDILLSV
jgi:hypothetical protein